MKEIAVTLFFMLFAGFLWVIAENYAGIHGVTQGAGTFPRIIITFLFFFAIWNIARTVISVVKIKKKKNEAGAVKSNFFVKNKEYAAIALVMLYYTFLTVTGFIPATLFFIPCMLYLTGYRKKVAGLLITLCSTAFLYVVFKILLGVPLPIAFFN